MCGGLFGGSPKIPDPPPPLPPPQPEKSPDADVFRQGKSRQAQQYAAMGGNQSTLLSGVDGSKDDNKTLGKSTLLGK